MNTKDIKLLHSNPHAWTLIDLLCIPNLILKSYVFIHCIIIVISLTTGNIRFTKCNGKNGDFEYNFLISCWYLNVKKQRIIVLQIENSQVLTTVTFWTNYLENIVYIFSLIVTWKRVFLSASMRNNSCKMYAVR